MDIKKVAGTNFIVDGFKLAGPHCRTYFLTHFHSDHYMGLKKTFDYGAIHTTTLTAELVPLLELGVEEYVVGHKLNEAFIVDGVEVTMLSANHCPGAAILLFRFKNGTCHLHTGDMRWSPRMHRENPILSRLAVERSVDTLYLDTTYCRPKHVHPSQCDTIQYVVNAVAEHIDDPECVFLFQAYTIGYKDTHRDENVRMSSNSARSQTERHTHTYTHTYTQQGKDPPRRGRGIQ